MIPAMPRPVRLAIRWYHRYLARISATAPNPPGWKKETSR